MLGLSGGVDSSVAATLLNKAIGKNLTCIFVDNGLLRKNEFAKVLESYLGLGLNVVGVDASNRFLHQLEGVSDPETKRKIELAAEDLVIAYETGRGWETERVGHLKIGFDIRSLGAADPQTGYRDPVHGVRRIEVKGRRKGQPIRLTTNEWYKAQQLGDSFWLYVVWDPLGEPSPQPLRIQNPAKHLDHAKKEVVAARFFDIPAAAVEAAALKGMP